MKNILFLTLILFSLSINAQLTQTNHAPSNGDLIFSTYQCDSTNINPGISGPSVSWNYSNLITHPSVINTYTTVTSANSAYNPADISISAAANNTKYYKSTSSELNYYGGNSLINGININLFYSNPAIYAIYPMSLNTSTTSITSGSVIVLGLNGSFSGNCNITVDATGTLVLPAITFTDVIRVVTSQTISTNITGGANIYFLIYDYYSPGFSKAPIFTINTSTISSISGTSSQTIVTVQKDCITGGVINNTQLTQANHAPSNGDLIFSNYQCDSTNINPGISGPSVSWNYSNLITHPSVINTYTTVTSSNSAYNPADISISAAANNTKYYKSTSSQLNYFGGDLSINGSNVNLFYSNPAIYAIYPMSLNTSTTSITSGSVIVLGQNGTFTGNCNITLDATGTLVLPAKTFTDVVRVVTSQTISTNIAGGANIYYLIYDYYSPGFSKAPIFTINTSTISTLISGTSSQTIVTVQKDYITVGGINETPAPKIELSVFPNPATNLINFTTTSPEATNVVACDISGKVVCSEAIESGKAKINTSNFTSGIYMYRVVGKYNQVLTTGKFTVSK